MGVRHRRRCGTPRTGHGHATDEHLSRYRRRLAARTPLSAGRLAARRRRAAFERVSATLAFRSKRELAVTRDPASSENSPIEGRGTNSRGVGKRSPRRQRHGRVILARGRPVAPRAVVSQPRGCSPSAPVRRALVLELVRLDGNHHDVSILLVRRVREFGATTGCTNGSCGTCVATGRFIA
jgi:hypothetical protein